MRYLAKRPTPRLRFVPRPIPGVWAEVHRAGQRHIPDMEKAFRLTMEAAAREMDEAKLARLLSRGEYTEAVNVFSRDLVRAQYEKRVLLVEYDILAAGARAALPTLPGGVVKQVPKPGDVVIGGFFDLSNPAAIKAAATNAATLVTNVTKTTRMALREVIRQAQTRGVSVPGQARQIAAKLRRTVGLTRPQVIALENLEEGWREAGLSQRSIDRNRRLARVRMIKQRSLVIARHETQLAANTGVHELWREASKQGLLVKKPMREWITQPPLNEMNPCKVCRPMDGQKKRLGELFRSPFNGATARHPPIHVQCMCVVVLSIR